MIPIIERSENKDWGGGEKPGLSDLLWNCQVVQPTWKSLTIPLKAKQDYHTTQKSHSLGIQK
jgi:hypothetical protein